MSTSTCPKCGAGLASGAVFCQACGQAIAGVSKPPAPGAKRMPVAALVILGGGLVVLLGAVTLYRSGALSGPGGTAAPAATATAGQPAPPVETPAPSAATAPAAAAPASAVPMAPVPAAQAPVAVAPAAPAPGASPAAGAKLGPAAPAAAAPPAAKPAPPPPPPPPPFKKTYECREYATFKIDPNTAVVTVDGEVIGIADEWADTPRTKKYKFANEGVHYVKLQHRDYETLWLRFIVNKDALDKTAIVELTLKEK
jgi:hypothetical protein